MRAAAPLDVASRDAFLQAVAARLAHHQGEVGEGLVFRTCAELQRLYFDAPEFVSGDGKSKYSRIARRARTG
jgi:hypothetical protein